MAKAPLSELALGVLPLRSVEYRIRVAERRRELKCKLDELLHSPGPFVLEVGCGHGHFLAAFAALHQPIPCIGIDIIRDRIERAKRKARRARLPSLNFILADAHEFLAALPSGAKAVSIFVLFPDPWPKRRHHKNRLLQVPFFDAIALRTDPGALFFFRTDYQPYFASVSEVVHAHRVWECVDEPWPFEAETVFQARADNYFSLVARRRL